MKSKAVFALTFSFLLLPALPTLSALADPVCSLRQLLVELPIRHADSRLRPAFLDSMKYENSEWIAETVRVPHPQYAYSAGRPSEFRDFLTGYMAGTRTFDEAFRSGSVSRDLRRVLKKQHVAMVRGGTQKNLYQGTTAKRDSRIVAGQFMSEGNPGTKATLDLKRPPSWNGFDGLDPPGDLPGPFPEDGQSWQLWFPEIVEKAKAKQLNLDEVLPTNFNKEGFVRHRYPRFSHQSIYIERMSEIMGHIENCLLRTHPSTPVKNVLDLLADYYQVGINAHLFERVNNSLLMSQVNYLLHYMGLNGIPHGHLDYLALYKLPQDFREAFASAVRARNAGV